MSQRQFLVASALVCGSAVDSHPGVVWHHVAEGLSTEEVRESACGGARGARAAHVSRSSLIVAVQPSATIKEERLTCVSSFAAAIVQVLLVR